MGRSALPNKPLVPTHKSEALLLAAQRRRCYRTVMKLAHLASVPILLFVEIISGQCIEESPADAKIFVREHEVHNFNGDAAIWAKDELRIWNSPGGTMCFTLLTFGPNGHECQAGGVLDIVADRRYRFSADVCSINANVQLGVVELLVTDGWRRRGEGGVCPVRFECGMFGSISSGRFTSHDANEQRSNAATQTDR